ncbi:MAG: hypothetical protein M5R36_08495 [Deltaproteobacteria bacterium]|nr:hypothetical protein [Deltaproteobacteria bacterium]
MGARNSYRGINGYAAKMVRFKARQLAGQYGISLSEQPDLEQHFMCVLAAGLTRHDPAKSKIETFIAVIVNTAAAEIIRTQKAAKRGNGQQIVSLEKEYEEKDGTKTKPSKRLNEDSFNLITGKTNLTRGQHLALQIDLDRAVESLPDNLKSLCRKLLTSTISEIARDSGVSRDVVYHDLKTIRNIFENRGLREYLRP